MKSCAFIIPALLAASQVAADDHLPAAPDYYLDTVIGISLAEQYDWHCPAVTVNGDAMLVAYMSVLAKLSEEGIPTDAPHENMQLPPEEETDAIIRDMLALHEGADDPEASFCTAARTEMADETVAGSFLRATE